MRTVFIFTITMFLFYLLVSNNLIALNVDINPLSIAFFISAVIFLFLFFSSIFNAGFDRGQSEAVFNISKTFDLKPKINKEQNEQRNKIAE